MRVTVNGELTEVPAGLTVSGLLEHLGLGARVAVELNRDNVPRAEHGARPLAEGDGLEIVQFVGGG